MMHSHVIIGDNSAEFGKICMEILRQAGFTANTTEKDGNQLLAQIDKEMPDVVIMDAYMKSLDAIGVMKQLNHKCRSNRPACIVTSSFENKFMEGEIMKQGVEYYILKPFDLSALVDRVNDLTGYIENDRADVCTVDSELYQDYYNEISNKQIEAFTAKVLRAMPMTVKLKGYHYVKDAILRVAEDQGLANAVTKELYPSIAKKYNTTAGAVEKAIRTAIELTWDCGNIETLNKLFGNDSSNLCAKPSNAKFIAEIAEYVTMMTQRNACRA
ncbi:MAG: sporulation transcription factor Spo0A [Clostridiales bacterium]|nr:sporulation transcription factor Spo0A [Clostridiales bacterium]